MTATPKQPVEALPVARPVCTCANAREMNYWCPVHAGPERPPRERQARIKAIIDTYKVHTGASAGAQRDASGPANSRGDPQPGVSL